MKSRQQSSSRLIQQFKFSDLWTTRRGPLLGFVAVFALVGLVLLVRTYASGGETLFNSAVVPKIIDSGDAQAVELGFKFKSDVAGTVTGVRFYKATNNTGTHIGNLWSSTGSRLASVTFTSESTSGWQQATFEVPVTIAANTIYVASYHTNTGHYSDDTSGFTRSIDKAPLHALADGATGPNGVYAYGTSSTFPTSGWQASNYWVDVVFNPEATATPTPTSTPAPSASSTPSPATTPAPTPNPSAVLSVDQQVVAHPTTKSNTVTSPSLSTSGGNELLEAFIMTDGPSGGKGVTVKSVTGGGLTWTLRQRSNTQPGSTEIWQAVAPSPLTAVTVTATLSGSYVSSMVVVAFKGADTKLDGATASADATKGAPTVSLTTTRNGSWVWGAGNDYDHAIARTLPAGQALVDQYLAAVGDTYWVQRQSGTTATSGTAVTLNATAPTSDRWNLAAIEILPAVPGTTPNPTPSPSPTASPTPTPTTSPSPSPSPTPAPDTTAPSAPGNLTATGASSTQINLAWSASTDNVSVKSYSIYRNGTIVGSSTATNYSDTNLTPGTPYSYYVKAFDAADNASIASGTVTASTQASPDTSAPTTPTGLTATATGPTRVNLTWAASTDNVGVTSYLVLRNNVVVATATATTYSDTGVVANTAYSYKVTARDAAGNLSTASAAASVTTPNPPDTAAPSVPTNLSATAVSSTQVNITWSTSTDNVAVAGYNVYRDGTKIATSVTTSFGDGTVTAGKTYSYTLSAYDGAGNTSAQTAAATVTTSGGATPTPTPPVGACPNPKHTPGGPDGMGGCWPYEGNTGVPAGTVLTAYTGPCTITTANTVIDKKTVNCTLDIRAKNVSITNSRINGVLLVDDVRCSSASYTVSDSTIFVNDINQRGLKSCSYIATRVDVSGGQSMAWCDTCTIQDSYLHNPLEDKEGAAANQAAHNSTVRMAKFAILKHNTLWCYVKEYQQPNGEDSSGCSANQTGYSHDGAAPYNSRIEANLYMPTSGGYCSYGGSTSGALSSVHDIVYENNVFKRSAYNGQGGPKCGYAGPITSFDSSRPGNQWINNRWDDGTIVPPAN